MAIALTIAGILLGMFLPLLSQWRAYKKQEDTRAAIAEIRLGLTEYFSHYGHLPCPAAYDDQGDVFEAQDCTKPDSFKLNDLAKRGIFYDKTGLIIEGAVPYRLLNIPVSTHEDGWGHPFTYVVTTALTKTDSYSSYGGKIGVTDGAGRSVIYPEKSAMWALISYGPDGGFGIPDNNCGSGIEAANCDHDGIYIAAPFNASQKESRYDDVVFYRNWIDIPEKIFPDQCVVAPGRIKIKPDLHVLQEGMIAEVCDEDAAKPCSWMICRHGRLVPGFLQNQTEN